MHKPINPAGYGFDKVKAVALAECYEEHFAPLVGKEIKLLELGVWKGASLLFWRDYFENGTIIGIDSNPVYIDDPTGMIHIYQGYQQDTELLDRVAREQAPNGFDIIIDDCSHIGRLARVSFWHLFQNHLKPGGLYAIEDWYTGYWDKWPDGRRYRLQSPILYLGTDYLRRSFASGLQRFSRRFPRLAGFSKWLTGSKIPSHAYGMVGFIKELIDAYVVGDKAIPQTGNGRYRHYPISKIHLGTDVVIVVKSKDSMPLRSGYTPHLYPEM